MLIVEGKSNNSRGESLSLHVDFETNNWQIIIAYEERLTSSNVDDFMNKYMKSAFGIATLGILL